MRGRDERGRLRYIAPDQIERNPENPRLFFRPQELDQLLVSINQHGIQVPVTVFEDKGKYFLLDGERRWICAKKLNLATMPALVKSRPSDLENLLLMYNIHALREQWDYFTIARSLQRIIDLFVSERGYSPNEPELSLATGLERSQIRRCRLLLELPNKYKSELQEELRLPKVKQKISEDTLIEMERSLKAVTKRFPEFQENIDHIRDALLLKVRSGTIHAVTDFRQLSKIATATDKYELSHAKVSRALEAVFEPGSDVGIRETFERIAQPSLTQSEAERNAEALAEHLADLGSGVRLPRHFELLLRKLRKEIGRVLGGGR